ncbi:class I SAM-dependent methyltransferase [Halomarina litorea]|uniref:class I SAM-dependent methyltransferase n=1 Tax=Halomarina litorea TaxID=2961595 RepID=UPI0020C26F52|nr:class I SAM-dependent methyltransferase [Halomarina sp. BCD28]
MYYFGIYHWRRRGRAIALGTLSVVLGGLLAVRPGRSLRRLAGLGAACWGARSGGRALRRLAGSPPWHVETAKYEALAALLPLDDADAVLDVGCGTGRSLVGLAGALSAGTTLLGLDVFDDRVILGNGPALARRNARLAGVDPALLRGDAARLPVVDGGVDVVTACRVLHDLPREAARRAVREAHRACSPGGTLGVLELPLPHDADADPATYWRDLVREAGFTVDHCEERTVDGREYVLVVGRA